MLNVFLSHTSRTSHTDRQCGKCGKCGFIFCLAIYTRARQKSALAAYKHTVMLMSRILMLIFGILTIRILTNSLLTFTNMAQCKNPPRSGCGPCCAGDA